MQANTPSDIQQDILQLIVVDYRSNSHFRTFGLQTFRESGYLRSPQSEGSVLMLTLRKNKTLLYQTCGDVACYANTALTTHAREWTSRDLSKMRKCKYTPL